MVTGAGSGIGRASAFAFAAEGARVAVVDLDTSAAAETVASIADSGGVAEAYACDVSDDEHVRATVDAITSAWGHLDAAHNNAGISPATGNTIECTMQQWNAVVAVNLTGVFSCMRHQIPAMLDSGGGAIVNTSSGVGLIGMANQPAYVATKHGVVGLTKAAALEFAGRGIRVNAVCPGTTLTGMVELGVAAGKYTVEAMASACPMGRLADPAEIAAAVTWLCSGEASFMTGAIVPVDGGTIVGPQNLR